MIRNLIFDIGNVLTDYRWHDFLLEKGFSEEMADRIAKASFLSPHWVEFDRGVWPEEKILQAFADNDPEIEEQMRHAFLDMSGLITPRSYAIPWLKALREQGFRLYYLSNYFHRIRVECAEALDFMPLMSGGVFSYEEKIVKPDPAIYKLLLERYSLKGEESVFLDDTLANVEAARTLGIHGIHFRTLEQGREELQKISNCGTLQK